MRYSKTLNTYALFLALISFIVLSCKSKNTTHYSSPKTGVKYNDPYNGGLQINKKTQSRPGPGLIAIEGGTFVMGGSLHQDLNFDYNNTKRRVTVASFYMDETAVSNADWLEYIHWIAQNYIEDSKVYYDALPDTLVWRHPLSYNEVYVDLYLRHPSYQDYPVVGVTWEQANEYCQWRTDRVNEHILREQGILADYKTLYTQKEQQDLPFNTELYLNGQLKGDRIDGQHMPKDNRPGTDKGAKRTVRIEDGILKQPYRLPTEAEWEYAALALRSNTKNRTLESAKIYPWDGLDLRHRTRKNRGKVFANFKINNGNMTGGVSGTVPVRSYTPNGLGLYNMVGNVNEWVSDVYRQLSFEDFEDFNPYRGHIFMDNKYENIETRQLAKGKDGKPIKIPATTARKQNWEELKASKSGERSTEPYNYDVRGYKDETNKELYGKTTLVNDKSRVYKGGSWNDRAYWLNPATRRHMQQDESNAMTGFRCAMTMVGHEMKTKR